MSAAIPLIRSNISCTRRSYRCEFFYSLQAGAFKIGDTAGTLDNIIACKLYRPGSVGFVSKSGGMSNEMYNVLSRATDGLYEGAFERQIALEALHVTAHPGAMLQFHLEGKLGVGSPCSRHMYWVPNLTRLLAMCGHVFC